jgi:hypothetical protein
MMVIFNIVEKQLVTNLIQNTFYIKIDPKLKSFKVASSVS